MDRRSELGQLIYSLVFYNISDFMISDWTYFIDRGSPAMISFNIFGICFIFEYLIGVTIFIVSQYRCMLNISSDGMLPVSKQIIEILLFLESRFIKLNVLIL